MKERLESHPDYDSKIRDHPIAVLQRIRVLSLNPTRGIESISISRRTVLMTAKIAVASRFVQHYL